MAVQRGLRGSSPLKRPDGSPPPGASPTLVRLGGSPGHLGSVARIGAHPGQGFAVGRNRGHGFIHDFSFAGESLLEAVAILRDGYGTSANVTGNWDGGASDLGRIGLALARPGHLLAVDLVGRVKHV